MASLRAASASRCRSTTPTRRAFRRWCATTPAPPWPRADQPARAAAAGCRGDQVGTVRPHPPGPAAAAGTSGWIRSLVTTCRDLRGRLAGRLASPASAAVRRWPRDRQGDPARAAAGLLHPGRHPGRRIHRDRPLRGAVPAPGQPFRPHRHPATLAAGSGLGPPGRAAAVAAAAPHRRRASTQPAGPQRNWASSWRSTRPSGGHDPRLLRRRAHAPVRRRPASPRTRRPAVAGDETPRWVGQHSSPRPPARWCSTRSASSCATHRTTGPRTGSAWSREFIVAAPAAGTTTGQTPRRPFPDEVARALADPDNLAASRRRARSPRSRTARHVGNHRAHRPPHRRGDRCPLGLPGPLRRAADVLARPDQGRQLRRRHPHPRTPLPDASPSGNARPWTHSSPPTAAAPPPPNAPRWRCFRPPTATPTAQHAVSYQWFHSSVQGLGRRHSTSVDWVAHQARHTLATNLLRAGASLTHIRTLPRPGQRPDGRTLRAPVEFGPGTRAAAGLGRRARHRQPRRTTHQRTSPR